MRREPSWVDDDAASRRPGGVEATGNRLPAGGCPPRSTRTVHAADADAHPEPADDRLLTRAIAPRDALLDILPHAADRAALPASPTPTDADEQARSRRLLLLLRLLEAAESSARRRQCAGGCRGFPTVRPRSVRCSIASRSSRELGARRLRLRGPGAGPACWAAMWRLQDAAARAVAGQRQRRPLAPRAHLRRSARPRSSQYRPRSRRRRARAPGLLHSPPSSARGRTSARLAAGRGASRWRRRRGGRMDRRAPADAVQHAHGRGVLHRDIKPDRITSS